MGNIKYRSVRTDPKIK